MSVWARQIAIAEPVAVGTVNAEGTSEYLVRADHVHKMPPATVAIVVGLVSANCDAADVVENATANATAVNAVLAVLRARGTIDT